MFRINNKNPSSGIRIQMFKYQYSCYVEKLGPALAYEHHPTALRLRPP